MAAAASTAQALELFADAERLAQLIIEKNLNTSPLADIAAALAAIDPDVAEGIAQSITDSSLRVSTLVRIAVAV